MSETREQAAEMSTPETLSGIFFEPGRTFEALRARPRFLAAAIILVVCFLAATVVFFMKVDYDQMIRQAIEISPRAEQMSPEQKEAAISMQTKPVFKYLFGFGAPLIGVLIFIALGGAIYMLGSMAMGKKISYKQGMAVWSYSSLPPTILLTIANIIMFFVRPPDPADAAQARGGMVHANLGLLVDRTAHPVMVSLLGSLDLFIIYGLVLAAIGLRKTGRMSSGAAWTIVIVVWLVGVLFKVGIAALLGQAMG
jgi:hypothetical protein